MHIEIQHKNLEIKGTNCSHMHFQLHVLFHADITMAHDKMYQNIHHNQVFCISGVMFRKICTHKYFEVLYLEVIFYSSYHFKSVTYRTITVVTQNTTKTFFLRVKKVQEEGSP